jgi:MFS family permease
VGRARVRAIGRARVTGTWEQGGDATAFVPPVAGNPPEKPDEPGEAALEKDRRALRPFVAAMVVDALGSGIYLPFSILYFVTVHSVAVTLVGTTVAVANAVMIPLSGVTGNLVDRFRPRRVLVVANLLRAVAFGLFPFATGPSAVVAVIGLTAMLDKVGWVAQSALIGTLARKGTSRSLFSTVGWVRNIGIGIGSAAGGVAGSFAGSGGLTSIVLLNAVSYAVAAVLLARFVQDAGSAPHKHPGEAAQQVAWRRDPHFLLLVGAKFCFTACAIAVANFLPFYLVSTAELPAWLSAFVLTANCVLVIVAQQHLTRRTKAVPRRLLLLGGGGVYATAGVLFLVTTNVALAVAVACTVTGIVVYTVGEIVIAPASDSLAADLAPPESVGRYMAIYQASWSAASVVVPAAGAALLDSAPGWFWTTFVALAVIGAAAGVRVRDGVPAGA